MNLGEGIEFATKGIAKFIPIKTNRENGIFLIEKNRIPTKKMK